MVDDREITGTFLDGFHLGAVIALGLAGKIVSDARQPFIRGRLTVMRNHAGNQRHHVGMLAGPGADAPFPLGISQFFITSNLAGLHTVF